MYKVLNSMFYDFARVIWSLKDKSINTIKAILENYHLRKFFELYGQYTVILWFHVYFTHISLFTLRIITRNFHIFFFQFLHPPLVCRHTLALTHHSSHKGYKFLINESRLDITVCPPDDLCSPGSRCTLTYLFS